MRNPAHLFRNHLKGERATVVVEPPALHTVCRSFGFGLGCYRRAMPYALFYASIIIPHSWLADHIDNADKRPL